MCTTFITEKILSQIADWVESGELTDASKSVAKPIKDEHTTVGTSEVEEGPQCMPAGGSEPKDLQAVTKRPVSAVQRSNDSSKDVPIRPGRRTVTDTKRVVAPVDEGMNP